jgi:ABC-type Fe3+-hydroxamate transport system substrate-binding protein
MPLLHDDLGAPVDLPGPARRVVSLVPSLTESVAGSGTLVGATDWCTHPADLDVTRVRGTKNPDLRAVVDLRPDVVLAVREENRELDVRRLREAGVPVWVSVVETVPQALDVLERVFDVVLQLDRPGWLREARSLWSHDLPAPTARVAVPVWRDPWMAVGRDTFTGDLLARLGWQNVLAGSPDRYPHVEVADLDRDDVDAVLLPDEPYAFSADDGPEAFTRTRPVLVSGRLLTWYGPSLVAARDLRL